jgi:hypothetical protein
MCENRCREEDMNLRQELTGRHNVFHNEKLHDLYSSHNTIIVMKIRKKTRQVVGMDDEERDRKYIQNFERKCRGKRALGRSKYRW